MKNELFSIGPINIHAYGVMIYIGIMAAYFVGVHRAKKHGLDGDHVFDFAVCCVLGGFLGSKILYCITDIKNIIANPSVLLNFNEGWVVYGGIIGGVLAAVVYARKKGLNFPEWFDILIPSVALAQGFGRIGCIFAGCCYGRQTDGILGMVFHNSSYAPNGVRLIPTQLLSSGLNFLHFAILVWFAGRKKGNGQVGGLYLILYSIGRFILEFYRGDLLRGSVGMLSTSQFISLFIFGVGVVYFVMSGREKAGTDKKEQ